MSYRNVMVNEITNRLTDLSDKGKDWKAALITKSICDDHSDELNEDAEFSGYNIYQNVRREVANVISKLAGDQPSKESTQLIFPGFEKLQMHYMVDGVGVYIENMSINQWAKKTEQYLKAMKGYEIHVDEIKKFVQMKFDVDVLTVKVEISENV